MSKYIQVPKIYRTFAHPGPSRGMQSTSKERVWSIGLLCCSASADWYLIPSSYSHEYSWYCIETAQQQAGRSMEFEVHLGWVDWCPRKTRPFDKSPGTAWCQCWKGTNLNLGFAHLGASRDGLKLKKWQQHTQQNWKPCWVLLSLHLQSVTLHWLKSTGR